MNHVTRKGVLVGFVLLALTLLSSSCKDTTITTDKLQASFTADQTSPGALTINMAEAFRSGDTAGVDVRVTRTTGIQEALFTIQFDRAVARFSSFAPGMLMEMDGAVVSYSVSEVAPGQIVVDIIRSAASGTVDADATEVLVRLNFRVIEQGSGRVDFVAPPTGQRDLLDGMGNPIAGLQWFGGTLRGQ